jgi:type IV secretory pathway TrbD component
MAITRETPAGAPVHRALVDPILIAGMERRAALTLFIAAAALIGGGGLHWYTLVCAALLLGLGSYALGKLAAYDPQFEQIVQRYAGYHAVYDAESPADSQAPTFQWSQTLPGLKRPAVPNSREIS